MCSCLQNEAEVLRSEDGRAPHRRTTLGFGRSHSAGVDRCYVRACRPKYEPKRGEVHNNERVVDYQPTF